MPHLTHINPSFISTAVLESAKVLRMASQAAKTKKDRLTIVRPAEVYWGCSEQYTAIAQG